MKRWNILFLFFCLHSHLSAQTTSGDFFIFKKDGSPAASTKEAAFLQHIFRLNDTMYISRYYNFAGPMIVQESYRDSALTIPNGMFCWYNASGELDSSGYVINGRKEGDWNYIISKREHRNVLYENGIRVKENIRHYDDKGKFIPAAENDTEKVMDPAQVPALFKNGTAGWVSYLQKNLQHPERIENLLPSGAFTTIISFLVDRQGNIKEVLVDKSSEWSCDAEALRIITNSPPWQPAVQFGEPVIYRQRQPITFQVHQ